MWLGAIFRDYPNGDFQNQSEWHRRSNPLPSRSLDLNPLDYLHEDLSNQKILGKIY